MDIIKNINTFNYYEKIITFDDFIFHNDILLAESLNINKYQHFKDNVEILKKIVLKCPRRKLVKMKDIYLFTFNRGNKSGGNYFHYHFHYMQKMLGFFDLRKINPNIKLGVPLNQLSFQKNLIFSLVNWEDIIFLDIYANIYEIKNCYVGKYISIHDIPKELIIKYQDIGRKKLGNLEYKPKNNFLYIRRKKKGNAGDNRIMKNENELINFLDKFNFQYLYFEDLNLEQKIKNINLISPKMILIEIGSGLTNFLYFSNSLLSQIDLVVIDQNNWRLDQSRIYSIIQKLNINHYIVTCKNIDCKEEKDIRNHPYEINIDKVRLFFKQFKYLRLNQ